MKIFMKLLFMNSSSFYYKGKIYFFNKHVPYNDSLSYEWNIKRAKIYVSEKNSNNTLCHYQLMRNANDKMRNFNLY